MADPELYRDQQRWREISDLHGDLQQRIGLLYQRWEELQMASEAVT
jgi:ATP-binding cassette, subfamily F, member 3